jgi:hypothetical protein
MKSIKYISIFFILILLACQEQTLQLPEKIAIPSEKDVIPSHFGPKSFSPRLKLKKVGLKKNIDFSAYLQNSDNLVPPPFARENSVAAVEKGCSKVKKVIIKYPTFGYDETATVTYRKVNLIDYIDYEYSDDPTYNGRTKFTYSPNGTTVTLTYTYTDGEISPYKDVVTLNSKGYAIKWLHDLSNNTYENPYTSEIVYNAAGFPTRFTDTYEGKIVADGVAKYTKENNFESYTEAISGNVSTYTYDLTKKSLLTLNETPFWSDFARFYGENNPNYLTDLVSKDKTGKTIFTLNIRRTFSADGYPKTITRKENGEDIVIFDVQSLDCKNYTFSAPRTWR